MQCATHGPLLAALCLSFGTASVSLAGGGPMTLSFALEDLAKVKASLAGGDTQYAAALKKLVKEADGRLDAGPFSVMQKKMVPPSGDKHDYASLAPYWWPDPAKPDGLPYVRRDGQYNPERANYDLEPMEKMSEGAQILALAYYFTGDAKYAEKSAALMRTWFLDAATKMNPNVRFAQFHPGTADEGVPYGVLETGRLLRVIDANALLADSPAWTDADRAGLKEWFTQYTDYLQTSPQGKAERASENNHGTWYAVQVASYLLYLDKTDEAKAFIGERGRHFIDAHLAADGSQPLELSRTRPLHYSRYNLRGMMDLARLGDRVGLDLWHYQNPKGATIKTALGWLTPKFLDPKNSGYKDIGDLKPRDLHIPLRWAAAKYDDPKLEAAIASLNGVNLKTDRTELLYPAPR